MPPTVVFFKRHDESRGTAILEECLAWPITRHEFDDEVSIDGEMVKRPRVLKDLDYLAAIRPSIFRTPKGEYFRRLNWHEVPRGGLKREHPLFVGLTREEGHKVLRFHGYDLPDDPIEPPTEERKSAEPTPVSAADALKAARGEALARTLEMITGCERMAVIVKYLAGTDEWKAQIDDIAVNVYEVRRCNAASSRKKTRGQVARTDERLHLSGAPIRVNIVDNVVYLILLTHKNDCTIETASM